MIQLSAILNCAKPELYSVGLDLYDKRLVFSRGSGYFSPHTSNLWVQFITVITEIIDDNEGDCNTR